MHEGVTLVSWGLCPSSCVNVYWALDSTSVCRSLAIHFIFFSGSPSLHFRCAHTTLLLLPPTCAAPYACCNGLQL